MIMETNDNTLYYLSDLSDYTIDDGYPDVRGWKVIDREQRIIGKVDNLIVNKAIERVVYLDVEVDESIIQMHHITDTVPADDGKLHAVTNDEGENHLLIPIGLVSLNEDTEEVITDQIDYQTLVGTKRIRENSVIDREYETMVLNRYNRNHTHNPEDDQFYDKELFKRNYNRD